jgi:hypothetical protein
MGHVAPRPQGSAAPIDPLILAEHSQFFILEQGNKSEKAWLRQPRLSMGMPTNGLAASQS